MHQAANPVSLSAYDVVNHSWISTDTSQDARARFDYQVATSGVVSVVGVNNIEYYNSTWNGKDVPPEFGWSYNSIAVGVASGYSSYGPTTLGTSKPDILGPVVNPYPPSWGVNGKTSWAAPVVASSAALLRARGYQQGWTASRDPRVIKAALMAGATKLGERAVDFQANPLPAWTHDSTHPLDKYQGAGLVNVENAWDIYTYGQQAPSPSTLDLSSGWDLRVIASGGSNKYFFNVPQAGGSFSAILDWYRNASRNGLLFSYDTLSNLDLRLYQVNPGTFSLGAQLAASVSTVDNVEHIWMPTLASGQYALVVQSPSSDTYGLAWQSLPGLTPGDINGDGQVNGDDFVSLAVNYTGTGGTGQTWGTGDFNGDGDVDGDDFVALAVNYTGSTGSALSQPGGLSGLTWPAESPAAAGIGSAAVPEPATAALLAAGIVAALRRRR